MKRILVARFFHETHTLLGETTSAAEFDFREGNELFLSHGDSSPLGGILEYADQLNWAILPTAEAHAFPSGTIEHEVFERFWDRFRFHAASHFDSGPVDAILLVLHGASVTNRCPDVEGEFLQRIRQLPQCSTLPLYGVYDLHANVSQAMVQASDCLVAYRENPHIDARDAALRAAKLLARFFETNIRPSHQFCQTPILWPPTGTATANDPMKKLLQIARQFEEDDPRILCINVNAGFGYSDVRDAGVSFSIVHEGEPVTAQGYLDQLAEHALEMAPLGLGNDEPVDRVIHRIQTSSPQKDGLVVLVEPSENIGGGAPGDGVALLRAALDANLINVLACIADPIFVQSSLNQNVGTTFFGQLGGKRNQISGEPLSGWFELVSCFPEAKFELQNKKSHLASAVGDFFNMGPCVVVKHRGATILVTSIKTPPMDLGQYSFVGLDPASFSFVIVKSAVAHRAAYEPIAKHQYWVDTPGPCSSNLLSFDYKELRRPIFPIDSLEAIRNHKPSNSR